MKLDIFQLSAFEYFFHFHFFWMLSPLFISRSYFGKRTNLAADRFSFDLKKNESQIPIHIKAEFPNIGLGVSCEPQTILKWEKNKNYTTTVRELKHQNN